MTWRKIGEEEKKVNPAFGSDRARGSPECCSPELGAERPELGEEEGEGEEEWPEGGAAGEAAATGDEGGGGDGARRTSRRPVTRRGRGRRRGDGTMEET